MTANFLRYFFGDRGQLSCMARYRPSATRDAPPSFRIHNVEPRLDPATLHDGKYSERRGHNGPAHPGQSRKPTGWAEEEINVENPGPDK